MISSLHLFGICLAFVALATASSETSGTNGEANINKNKNNSSKNLRSLTGKNSQKTNNKSKTISKINKNNVMERATVPARITFLNADILEGMTAAESIFVEDSIIEAYKMATFDMPSDDDTEIHSAIIQNHNKGMAIDKEEENKRHGGRYQGAGGHHRSLFFDYFNNFSIYDSAKQLSYFDIFVYIEPWCSLCPNGYGSGDQDDDAYYGDRSYYGDDGYTHGSPATSATTTTTSSIEGGGGSRLLQKNGVQGEDLHRRFEDTLCKLLREGEFDVFKTLEGCQIVYTAS